MAEFLAVTGGLAAVVQLAASGRHLAKTLYRFAVDAGAYTAEVERFANQVRTFSDTVEVAEQTLSRYCRDNPTSRLVVYMERRKVLANIDSEATTVRAHLRAVREQVIDMKSRSILWASIKWSWKKSSILELSPEMESAKTNLSLLMVTAQFEAMARSGNNDKRLRKQMLVHSCCSASVYQISDVQGHFANIKITRRRRLQRVIKHHLETRRDLRVQLDPARYHGANSYDSLDLDLTPEDPLEELGWSICDHGTVPDSPPTSPASSEDHFIVRRAPPNRPNQPRMTRQMPRERRGPDTTPPPSTPSQPGGSAPSLRRVPLETPPPPPKISSQTGSPDFPARPLVNNTLRYRGEDVCESIGGYVRTPRGALHQITASLVETFNANIISIGTAQALDLEIEALRPDEGVMFDFGSSRAETSIGKVTFQWKVLDYINPRYPPLTVTCDVCENSTIGLVLGRPFIRERERRWSRSSSVTKY
jgi:hypothetical protein